MTFGVAADHFPGLPHDGFSAASDVYRLKPRKRANQFLPDCRNGLELTRPSLWVVRPGKPSAGVRFPFGGKAIAKRGGRTIVRTEQRRFECKLSHDKCSCAKRWWAGKGRSEVRSIEIAFREICIGVDSSVSQERPMRADNVDLVEIAFDQKRFFFIVTGAGEDIAVRIADERCSPELNAAFQARAIGGGNEHAVGDGVAAHHGFPSVVLASAELRFLCRLPADCRGIENDLSTGKRGKACGLWKPLIPADAGAEAAVLRVKTLEAEIARREVELFIKQRIVGNVHLAIDAGSGSVDVEDNRRVVVDARRPAFKKRANHDHAIVSCRSSDGLACGAGNGLGVVKATMVFCLARIVAGKQFLQANNVCAGGRSFCDSRNRFGHIRALLLCTRHLDNSKRNVTVSHRRRHLRGRQIKWCSKRRSQSRAAWAFIDCAQAASTVCCPNVTLLRTMRKPVRGLFITGTDTNVGKTHVGAMIARQLAGEGRRVGVYKPVASGCYWQDEELLSEDAVTLWNAAGKPGELSRVCPQRFEAPLAPHLAAQAEEREIDAKLLRTGLEYWLDESEIVVVEGAGGLMSPVSEEEFVADLAHDFGLPLIVVSRNMLGAINQTLQTLITAATFRDGLTVAGVVLNNTQPPGDDASLASNRTEIERRSVPPVLAELAYREEKFALPIDWFSLSNTSTSNGHD